MQKPQSRTRKKKKKKKISIPNLTETMSQKQHIKDTKPLKTQKK